jgi:ribosome-binding ATPase
MAIAAGLVGLPNVGKSTLFNALTNSQVPAENYPFCTIDPHLACTEVPDHRIAELKKIYKSQRVIPTTVQFVDIAGLVKGAASGEGLGNQFLSHIREVDLILHVLRCFEDPSIIYGDDLLDPIRDYEIILTELALKDLESIVKRQQKVAHLIKSTKNNPPALKELEAEAVLLTQIEAAINGNDIQSVKKLIDNSPVKTIPVLVAKNFLVIANVSEKEIAGKEYEKNPYYQKLISFFGASRVIPVCARLEHELSALPEEEAAEMASMMGLEERGLPTIIRKSFEALGLITFFTCGPQEIHAWSVRAGTPIRKASGEIHSDLERGFICAEVFNAADLLTLQSEAKVKDSGKMRVEGQDYMVKDGDIIHVRFNV